MLLRRRLLALFALVAIVMLTGCGPRWLVLSQAVPNVLLGQQRFAVHPIDFAGVMVGVKDEGSYLDEKSESQRVAWASDKDTINEKFAASLMRHGAERGFDIVPATGPGSAPFFIRVHAARMEPGFYAVVASKPGAVALEVTITTADGRPIDRVMFEYGANGFSVTQRFANSATEAGAQLGRYLQSRSAPGSD